MTVDPLRPIGPRPDLAPVQRTQLTRIERDEARRERDERRRRRENAAPERSDDDAPEGIDFRV
jgi:hypothetical protein